MGDIVTTKELASYLKLSVSTVTKLAKQGKLPGIKVGRSWRFQMDNIPDAAPRMKIIDEGTDLGFWGGEMSMLNFFSPTSLPSKTEKPK